MVRVSLLVLDNIKMFKSLILVVKKRLIGRIGQRGKDQCLNPLCFSIAIDIMAGHFLF